MEVYSSPGKKVHEMAIANRVDARGKRCPMPVLMAKRAIAECNPGDAIEIFVTTQVPLKILKPLRVLKVTV